MDIGTRDCFHLCSVWLGTWALYLSANANNISFNGIVFIVFYMCVNLFKIICTERVTMKFIIDYVLTNFIVVVFVKIAHIYFNEYGISGWFLISCFAATLFTIVDKSIYKKGG